MWKTFVLTFIVINKESAFMSRLKLLSCSKKALNAIKVILPSERRDSKFKLKTVMILNKWMKKKSMTLKNKTKTSKTYLFWGVKILLRYSKRQIKKSSKVFSQEHQNFWKEKRPSIRIKKKGFRPLISESNFKFTKAQ
jgi:hypothetical protein